MIPEFDHTGPFIWAAYGFSAGVIALVIAAVIWRARAAKARLDRLQGLGDSGEDGR